MLLLFLGLLQTAGKQSRARICSCKISCLIMPDNTFLVKNLETEPRDTSLQYAKRAYCLQLAVRLTDEEKGQ